MKTKISGIHHITALASKPQNNYDFYSKILGLRLVKKTVNFDAPDVYHFYFGDALGTPGSIITFFPFPNAVRGKRGTGEINKVIFRTPKNSSEYWINRLERYDVPLDKSNPTIINFLDPDGLLIEIREEEFDGASTYWKENPVPEEFAISNIYGAGMVVDDLRKSKEFLTGILGLTEVEEGDNLNHVKLKAESGNQFLELVEKRGIQGAVTSAGSVHHIAWRTADIEEQKTWKKRIEEAGISTTQILDRRYFSSIYFREPGNVLFEIATDGPGFLDDEDENSLGKKLKLPSWFEERRQMIESVLPEFRQ